MESPLKYDFNHTFNMSHPSLKWSNTPNAIHYNTNGLEVFMDKGTDFWRKTYYKPTLIKNNGHFLYQEILKDEKVCIETKFRLNSVNQFDQAGLLIHYNNEYWLKCGIEYCDGKFGLSCVNTNQFSDWSTNEYLTNQLTIQVYKLNNDIVVEAKVDEQWQFVRICHLSSEISNASNVKVGVYCCSPTEKGGSVVFEYLNIRSVEDYAHKN